MQCPLDSRNIVLLVGQAGSKSLHRVCDSHGQIGQPVRQEAVENSDFQHGQKNEAENLIKVPKQGISVSQTN